CSKCRRDAPTATATSVCWCERQLTANFRGDPDRLELGASRRCSLLPRFACCVFRIARRLLVLFERRGGLLLGTPRGVLPDLLYRHGMFPRGFLSRALCVSQVGGCPFRGLVFGRANVARFRRFDPCSLLVGG